MSQLIADLVPTGPLAVYSFGVTEPNWKSTLIMFNDEFPINLVPPTIDSKGNPIQLVAMFDRLANLDDILRWQQFGAHIFVVDPTLDLALEMMLQVSNGRLRFAHHYHQDRLLELH